MSIMIYSPGVSMEHITRIDFIQDLSAKRKRKHIKDTTNNSHLVSVMFYNLQLVKGMCVSSSFYVSMSVIVTDEWFSVISCLVILIHS